MPNINDQIFKLWRAEQENLAVLKEKNPELFIKNGGLEEKDILSRIGIALPFKNRVEGYIKYHPFDFIVEEISKDGKISTVDYEPINSVLQEDKSQTVYADAVKVGISTVDAVKELCRVLQISENQIGVGGIKDAIALTSQRMSFRKISADAFAQISPASIFFKNIQIDKGAINVGDLWGNRFTILVRSDKALNIEILENELDEIRANGFWNFYWLQRFGNRLLSHWWGLLLFQGKYEDAVYSYLFDQGTNDLPFIREARAEAQRNLGNWPKAEEIFTPLSYTMRHELVMIRHLKDRPRDFIGALNLIPEQVKLWIYAYTSYLFNRFLSFSVTRHPSYPRTLPLILSSDQNDHQIYRPFLAADQVPLNFSRNLRTFPFIRLARRTVKTKIIPQISGLKFLPEGVVISFDLEKGAYATTFLSHLFSLKTGLPVPEWVKTKEYDLKNILGTGSTERAKKVLEKYIVTKEIGESENNLE